MGDPQATLARRVWTAAPSEALRPYVRGYVAQAIDVPPGTTATLTIAATVYPVLMATYAGAVRSEEYRGGEILLPQVEMSGPVPVAFRSTFAGRPRGFFVHFEPTATLALFGVEGPHKAGVSTASLVHPEAAPRLAAWGQEIAAAGDEDAAFDDRVAHTERFLQGLLADDALASSRARAAEAARLVAHVVQTDGAQRVQEMADRLGVSESTLRRRFREALGIPPKLFSAVVRFRHALAYIHAHPGTSWARVASRFGYADQSHLIRDYRRFAGVVPTRWDDAERFIDLNFGILDEGGAD